ncbi:pentapeptide repeat-containing protein [Leptothoe sp. PORK10 BA2]|uniref:pentapeptide repeat-containing protein n=1 Tax=Leptothoe sp. PORK10 BA2 TaxID=3110254 RepID=UPI002B204D7D|nr:pentapeptide repeat-containing protein [Leptothoe sp. PORK10 BA2]MEA5462748.1 pentapeptide repeat-containing protein [Leptothoe sp. PORK10 BA2]
MAQQIMNAQNSMVLVPKTRSAWLGCRRLAAWSLEVGLVAMGAALPWAAGQYALMNPHLPPIVEEIAEDTAHQQTSGVNQADGLVALNPLVSNAQKGWARIAQVPPHQLHRTVPYATNILWTVALITPVVIAGGQLVQMGRTGQTWPRRWLGIRVISTASGPLKLPQVLFRELGRWGAPLIIVGGISLATNFSLGLLTPVMVGLLALVEGATAVSTSKRSWHDRLAKTQVEIATAGYLPMYNNTLVNEPPWVASPARGESLVYSPPWSDALLSEGNEAVQLYGETANDDDWWLTEAEGNLTSIVLAPRALPAQQNGGGRLVLVNQPAKPERRSWLLLTCGMVAACAAGFGLGRVTQSPAKAQAEEDVFLQTAQALSAQAQSGGDYSAAILMLGQVENPRTAQYLTDLLSQTSQPETLATIQQALVSQGLDSLSPLLALSRALEHDLQQPLDADTRHSRLEQRHVVQGAIAKLLAIHSNELVGTRLDRINLGHYHDAHRTFRLIQPGLLAAGTSWQGANLSQANLAGASFFDVGADGRADSYDDRISDFTGSILVAASLEEANLQGAQLTNANLRQADLKDANLAYGNLERSQLTNAQLVHVHAPQSHWQGSNLVGADLTQAVFNGADFTQARLNRVEAAHSSWTEATLPQSDWVGANLIGADFSQTSLTRANFQGANLDSVNFSQADLRQANLRDTDLRQAQLTGVNLTDADLAGAIFHDGANVNNSFITPNAQLSSGNHLRGVNFSRARNLDSRQLNYICTQGGIHPNCQDSL